MKTLRSHPTPPAHRPPVRSLGRRSVIAIVATGSLLTLTLGAGVATAYAAPAASAGTAAARHDGRIAFVRNGDIYTSTVAGTKLQRLTRSGNASHPKWSSDGTQLVFERAGYVWTMTSDGSHQVRHWQGSGASWSPDGQSLAYIAPLVAGDITCGGAPAVVTRRLSGGAPHVLDFDTFNCSGFAVSFTKFDGQTTSWSTDGKRVLYSFTIPNGSLPDGSFWAGDTNIAEFDLTMPYPDPSSGTWTWPPPGQRQLGIWKPSSTPQIDYAPVRDNYVYASNAGQADHRTRIFVHSRYGSYQQQITPDVNVSYPMYSPDNAYVYYTQATTSGPVVKRVRLGAAAPPALVLTNAAQPALQPAVTASG